MATIMGGAVERGVIERRFYARMAWLMVAIIVVGFAPSFYLRGLVEYPRPNPTLPPHVLLHATLFTAWLALFVVQTQLVARGRRDLHRRFGSGAFLLAVALVPLMYATAVWQVARANQMPFTDPLNWSIVPLAGIIPFAILLWIGWSRRRDAAWHKRAMLGAMILVMQPGIGRIPIGPPVLAVHALGCALTLALYIPPVLHDRGTFGRVHPATLIGFALASLTMLVQLAFLQTGAWAPIAARLPGIGA